MTEAEFIAALTYTDATLENLWHDACGAYVKRQWGRHRGGNWAVVKDLYLSDLNLFLKKDTFVKFEDTVDGIKIIVLS